MGTLEIQRKLQSNCGNDSQISPKVGVFTGICLVPGDLFFSIHSARKCDQSDTGRVESNTFLRRTSRFEVQRFCSDEHELPNPDGQRRSRERGLAITPETTASDFSVPGSGAASFVAELPWQANDSLEHHSIRARN